MIALQCSQTLKMLCYLKKLKQIYNNVKFTYKLEGNKQLSFLDVNVVNLKEKLELFVYRKPANIRHYNKWDSLAPARFKINLMRSLVERAIKICNNRQLMFLDCEKITKILQ